MWTVPWELEGATSTKPGTPCQHHSCRPLPQWGQQQGRAPAPQGPAYGPMAQNSFGPSPERYPMPGLFLVPTAPGRHQALSRWTWGASDAHRILSGASTALGDPSSHATSRAYTNCSFLPSPLACLLVQTRLIPLEVNKVTRTWWSTKFTN